MNNIDSNKAQDFKYELLTLGALGPEVVFANEMACILLGPKFDDDDFDGSTAAANTGEQS